ncbi:MAG: class I SAM-dependent methyltransferase [Verrucomicrobiota bacterium]|nr:class I SAM-dependent methyltransferase [Verrucomicrobiota bacterium]
MTIPPPPAREMAAYYPAGYYGAPGERRFPAPVEYLQKKLYEFRVRRVESVAGIRRGRVLDVGCGRGGLLQAFRRRGWEVQGTELSDQAAAYARQVLQLPVAIGSLETLDLPSGHFDAVTLWHVLEHLPDSEVLLAEVRRLLKPDGVLLVGVPNFGGWESRFCRDKWFHLDVPRHLNHFTKAALRQALSEAGFRDRSWSGFAPEYDAYSFVQSSLNRCGLCQNLLYNWLRGGRAKIIESDAGLEWQKVAVVLLALPLGLVSLPFTTCAGLANQAGTMSVLASVERLRQSPSPRSQC